MRLIVRAHHSICDTVAFLSLKSDPEMCAFENATMAARGEKVITSLLSHFSWLDIYLFLMAGWTAVLAAIEKGALSTHVKLTRLDRR